MKEKLDEYDMTKKLLGLVRGDYKSRLIKEEASSEEMTTESDDQKDTISPVKGDSVFNDELKKLQDIVDPRVDITNFKIYPTDSNVIIEGVFLKKENEDSGIKFRMSLTAGDIETSMNDIDLSDKVSLLLQKLKGYYDNWVNDWSIKLSREYKPKTD